MDNNTTITSTSTSTDLGLESALTNLSDQKGDIFERVELKRDRFSAWSVVGIQFSITAAPLAILTYVGLVTGVGGTSYFFWCYLVSVVGQLLVSASLAEVAAFLPHASGQSHFLAAALDPANTYHSCAGQVFWTGALAPPKSARFLSYVVGAFTTLGWILGIAGASVYTGNFWVSFGMVINSSYIPELYQIYVVAAATMLIASILNTWAVRVLPAMNKFMVVFLNAAAFYVFVVLLAKASPKNSAHDGFLEVTNDTGWSSDGFVFLLGFLPGLLTMSVPDAPSHMAEEVPDPEKTIPLVMFATSCLNAGAGMIMVVTIIFCTVHPENLLEPVAHQPALQLVLDAWDNTGWVITVTLILIVVNGNACVALLTGGSRLLWAFAKTGGLPFGSWFGRTNQILQVPVISIFASAVVGALLALLVFGPYTVLNGIFGCSILCLNVSYWVSILFMLLKDRKSLPEKRYFNLGRAGPYINVLALVWLTLTEVTLCLPTYYPLTMDNMNWASAVFVGLTVLILGNWFVVKGTYQIPKPIYVERLHAH